MSDQQNTSKSKGLWLSRAALGFVAMAAVMGWGASFVGLHAYGQDQMVGFSYWSAWLIPATFDGAAFGATLITYRASIHGRSAFRGRLLMWIFTAISSWINWIHQMTPEARIVAAGLPVAAVAVFDVVLAELRADYEERHGKRRLRLRPGLLLLRWLVDRGGTSVAFRRQVTDIPVSEIAGLGTSTTVSTESPAFVEPSRDVAPAVAPQGQPVRQQAVAAAEPAEAPTVAVAPAAPAARPVVAAEERERAVPSAPSAGEPQAVPHSAARATGAPEEPAAKADVPSADREPAKTAVDVHAPAQRYDRSAGKAAAEPAPAPAEAPEPLPETAADKAVEAAEPAPAKASDTATVEAAEGDAEKAAAAEDKAEGPSKSDADDTSSSEAGESATVQTDTAQKDTARKDEDPGEKTEVLPVVKPEQMTDQDKREAARRDYRRSLEDGQPLSGVALGRRYGFSERWGRTQIAAVRDERRSQEQAEEQEHGLVGADHA
ncbi:uncharacterized protein DUF2637 [Saccharopolyspora erythraea NRRL 2338]|uniref:Mucin-associated surface protein n=2 Tax=Saccharopolyspora erythraea TaxID=1836 RepID=A4FQK4_SACEN|nr:DUF2637 domain-containing protein [Saccharopolyspora erythraea]EQD87741.1 mucin [Saccharopolyspora erythraea D]PFG92932.1 uncharacterized protein DUF2637 [Saccharopolyspora erythraea NRRL 2338]QRK89830.1 DUF2637 domain-containing protein [Saccharopolyspora erythraea]CAM06329.1 mucin-associated surface protein [Saccharopolyspora erythraea NRRL 2338]